MNTEPELRHCLSSLPRPTHWRLATDLVYGIAGRGYDLARLVHRSGGYVLEAVSTVDLCTRSITARRLFQFEPRHDVYRNNFNSYLSGQRGNHPMVEGVGSMLTSLCSGGAGYAFTALTAAIHATSPSQLQQTVRVGDEIWQIEAVGKDMGTKELKHVIYWWLVDPHRGGTAGQAGYAAWLIHEDRRDFIPAPLSTLIAR